MSEKSPFAPWHLGPEGPGPFNEDWVIDEDGTPLFAANVYAFGENDEGIDRSFLTLAAAAPDLYERVRVLAEALHMNLHSPETSWLECRHPRCQLDAAALAKARGEEP